MSTDTPKHGYTKSGTAVHARTIDHLRTDTAYQRFNKRLATKLTSSIGTMTTFWVFVFLSLLSLPATLALMGLYSPKQHYIGFFLSFGWIYLITWICQNFIQLVLLPALMVGQNLQNEASDARTEKQFEDTEGIAKDIKKIKALLEEKKNGN